MKEVLKHLQDQPSLWPRWRRGYSYDGTTPRPRPTKDQHFFVFVREGDIFDGRFGTIYPACHFVEGADRVLYDDERRLVSSDSDPLCEACLDVEIAYVFDALPTDGEG